jgi:hypothetical protein
VLSGTLIDGTVIVDTNEDVSLILKNTIISSGSGSKHTAIAFYGTGKHIVSIAAGTTNTLVDYADHAKYSGKDKPKGAIYSEKDLTINGSGNLTLSARNHSGLYAKGKLKIADGHITVNEAPNSALRGDEGVIIRGGTFNLKSVKDTIKAESDAETDYIYIENADITIETLAGETLYKSDASKAGYYVNQEGKDGWDGDGVSATSAVWIRGGAINITTADGARGTKYEKADTVTTSSGEKSSADPSLKGIKTDGSLLIEGGTITLNTRDDGINAGHGTGVTPYDSETSVSGKAFITGGTITITCDQDAIKGEAGLQVSGGTINIVNAYEGLEGTKVIVSGGTITSNTMDKIINASGGPEGTIKPGHFAIISGGTIEAFSPNNVIDANGSLLITGGSLFLTHRGTQVHEPIDTEYGYTITGGTLFAASDSDLQLPAKNSSQVSIVLYWAGHPKTDMDNNTNLITQNDPRPTVTVKDEDGKTVGSWTVKRSFNKLIISSPDVVIDKTYTVSVTGQDAVKFKTLYQVNPVFLYEQL